MLLCALALCTFIITGMLSNVPITWIYKACSGLGNYPGLFQSCSLRPALNFSCYIQSCWVHIHAIFTCVRALIHWHYSQCITAIPCSSPKSCALAVTVVAVQHMIWGLEAVLHKNLHILAYLLYSHLNYLLVSLDLCWQILSIWISSWCSCWSLKSSGMWLCCWASNLLYFGGL
jgi:hypothetical protein